MAETEPIINTEAEAQRSVEILTSLQDCSRFEQDQTNKDRICLLYYIPGRNRDVARKYYAKEEFYRAVDYYYENRVSELEVDLQMNKPNGEVAVYSPDTRSDAPRRVVVRLKNYIVPQILEFAYLLLRQDQKKSVEK